MDFWHLGYLASWHLHPALGFHTLSQIVQSALASYDNAGRIEEQDTCTPLKCHGMVISVRCSGERVYTRSSQESLIHRINVRAKWRI